MNIKPTLNSAEECENRQRLELVARKAELHVDALEHARNVWFQLLSQCRSRTSRSRLNMTKHFWGASGLKSSVGHCLLEAQCRRLPNIFHVSTRAVSSSIAAVASDFVSLLAGRSYRKPARVVCLILIFFQERRKLYGGPIAYSAMIDNVARWLQGSNVDQR